MLLAYPLSLIGTRVARSGVIQTCVRRDVAQALQEWFPFGKRSVVGNSKQMQTFRMPSGLVVFLKAEAGNAGRDLTGHVVRCLEGIRAYFGLPEAATSLLESDRKALGMDRLQYLLHVLFQRSLSLREHGPGFDAPKKLDSQVALERPDAANE